jgi:hypothetical protein
VNRFSKRCLSTGFVLAFSIVPGWGAAASDLEEDALQMLRQNPTLRGYFSRQALDSHSSVDRFGQRQFRGSPDELERHTDRLIEHFHRRLVSNLEDLDSRFQDAQQARSDWLSAPQGAAERRLLWSRSRSALDEVAGRARDLRRLLSFPLVSLDSRDDFDPDIPPESAASGFEAEFAFLEEELARAVEEIEGYFLVPTHTVTVHDLQSPNMMIHLHRVREMARALSRIDPPEPPSE